MSLRKLRVVNITNVPEAYPECRKDTADFADLVVHVKDETARFVVDEVGERFWPADEFFNMNNVKEIMADPVSLE